MILRTNPDGSQVRVRDVARVELGTQLYNAITRFNDQASAVLAMHLAAASLGLATQWLSDFGSPWLEGMTSNLLRIPHHFHIYEPMAVGQPSYYPKPRYVKPLEEFVHRVKYDPAKSRTEEEICEYIDAHLRPGLKRKT